MKGYLVDNGFIITKTLINNLFFNTFLAILTQSVILQNVFRIIFKMFLFLSILIKNFFRSVKEKSLMSLIKKIIYYKRNVLLYIFLRDYNKIMVK